MPTHDSRIIGDYDLGDLIGDDDLGDLIGDDDDLGDFELGRRRRRQRARVQRLASKLGMQVTPRASAAAVASSARTKQLRALNMEAQETGEPVSAGHFVADGGQRELYLPFSATGSLAAAIGSTVNLTTVVQRPIMFRRLILDALDATTLADVLATAVVSNFLIGVQPVFNASGVAPARAFAFNAVGNRLLTPVARVGTTITVQLTRIATGANAATCSGYLVGVSADS